MSTPDATLDPTEERPDGNLATDPSPSGLDPALTRVVAAILTGAMAVIFDMTIVAVAIHELATTFDAPVDTIQWVSTAYLLAMVGVLPAAGWAQQRLGGKRLWLLALATFTLGSVACGFAWSATSLIAFRAFQGLGGGLMLPLMATLLMQAAGGRSPGRLMAAVSLPTALGPILGPVIGGLVLHLGDWSWLFWINVPLGIAGLALASRWLPADPPSRPARLDVLGLALGVVGVVALVLGLSNVAREGGIGHADVLVPAGAGLALLAGFTVRALRAGPGALVDLALLRHRPLATSSTLMALAGVALTGAMFVIPLFFQEVRGADPLTTGLLLIPQGVGALASRGLAGRLTDALGPRPVVVAGFAIATVATVPFAWASTTTSGWLLGAALLVRGVGIGAVFIPLMATAYVGLERDEIPHASILTRIGQQVGGSFGIALLAVVLQSTFTASGAVDPVSAAFGTTFWWVIAFTAIGIAVAALLPGRPGAADATGA
ncbi:multidrug efflux MFS transporter [Actinotalea sp. M2MS4P-6]|uniref:MDR family MFS transporter n=1 Tax=Actinotalea sp. M2MS4P-6 TaxID=2983762 RepID=UPI0021E3BAAA|nr:MDR family MFS transporter [Actinotalea sp. M2MS4P-6]MCV2395397.1 multidrug efflux MFS transporter [Actinotalea sp. M2MS4P-6]